MQAFTLRRQQSALALGLGAALLVAFPGTLQAEEVEGTLACHKCKPAVSCYPPVVQRMKPCYDPCEPVGPIRRFFRRVFLRPCPPPCPAPCPPRGAAMVAVVPGPAPVAPAPFAPPPPPPEPAPVPFAPSAPAPAPSPFGPPSAEMGRPVPVPPSSGTTESYRSDFVPPTSGSSYPRLTPPVQEPPIRADRIASLRGSQETMGGVQGQVVSTQRVPQGHVEVTLVSARQPNQRQRIASNAEGRFGVRLPSGEWLVYTRNHEGQWVPHGRVEIREHQTAKVTIVSQ